MASTCISACVERATVEGGSTPCAQQISVSALTGSLLAAPRAPKTGLPSVSRATGGSTYRWTTLALTCALLTAVASTATVMRGNATARMGTRAPTVATLQTRVPTRAVAPTGDASTATVFAKTFTPENNVLSRQKIPAVS